MCLNLNKDIFAHAQSVHLQIHWNSWYTQIRKNVFDLVASKESGITVKKTLKDRQNTP